jgi:hypothetical protein
MACDQRTATIFLEAASVRYGAEELSCITPNNTLTGGEYFNISSIDTDFYVWTDIDDGSVDPAPANRTGIEVDVSAGYTVADWITAFKSAIEAVVDVNSDPVFFANASSDGLSVSVEAIDIGAPNAPLADFDTSFTFEVDREGFGGDLGKTKEGIEVSFEASTFDVQSNQTGLLLLDQIIQSTGASLSASFLELTEDRLRSLIAKGYGDSYTPGGGTEVFGFGTSKNFQSSFDQGGKLILHPIRLPDTNRSADVVFWKTLPLPESINYDGTDSQALSASFTALVDESKREEIRVFARGDWKQDLRA